MTEQTARHIITLLTRTNRALAQLLAEVPAAQRSAYLAIQVPTDLALICAKLEAILTARTQAQPEPIPAGQAGGERDARH